MKDKSHVSMEQRVCVACGNIYDTNSILLHKRLAQVLDRHTVTGFGMCAAHQKVVDDGYVIMVAVDPTKSVVRGGDKVKPGDVYRTGELAYIKAEAYDRIISVPRPPGGVCFVHPEVLELLRQKQVAADAADPGPDPDL